MPKKFPAENPKAAAARERKKAAKDAECAMKQKHNEDAMWEDDDKMAKKRQQKKEELERKKEQHLAKKAEAKLLLEKEMNSIKSSRTPAPVKATRAQIAGYQENIKKEEEKSTKGVITDLSATIEENMNRLEIDGAEARNIDEAIEILSNEQDAGDRHPEKRQKALYNMFEKRRLEELKTENSTLRLSQMKQLIFKEWQKSPDNPLNKQ